jgi:predicted AlkP superfamily pyrophosphatase or phosphodiesterase
MISVDGMRPDYVTKADTHKLKLPVLRSFMQDGMYANGVIGVLPTVTFPSHATLVTGVWPDKHGIYNNVRFDPFNRNKDAWYWYESDFKAPTLWHAAAQAGIVTASVFWPTTTNANDIDYLLPAYPARIPEDAKLIEALSRPIGYLAKVEKQTGPFYILASTLDFDELLTKVSESIIRDGKPGFMTVHLVSLDHYEHLTGPFSPESNHAMEEIDGMIGRLVEAERANDAHAVVMVVSDHGFAATHTSVNLLIPFVDAGLIQIKKSPSNPPLGVSWKATAWNADGCAYILLHDPNDRQTLSEVKTLLDQLQNNPTYGISRILTHEEIVARGGDPNASFLVAWSPGFSGGGALEGNMVNSIPGTGTHGYLPDFPELQSSFFAIGSGIPHHCDVGTIDMRQIAPTVAAYLGVSLPDATQPAVRCNP